MIASSIFLSRPARQPTSAGLMLMLRASISPPLLNTFRTVTDLNFRAVPSPLSASFSQRATDSGPTEKPRRGFLVSGASLIVLVLSDRFEKQPGLVHPSTMGAAPRAIGSTRSISPLPRLP